MSDQVSNSDVIVEKVNALSFAYPSDLDINFAKELIQFRSFMSDSEGEKCPTKLLEMLQALNLQSVFPNVFVV